MICAIMMGRAGSTGFPNKNLYPLLGRPLAEYPILAAWNSKEVDHIFITTDSPELVEIGKKYNAEWIQRPIELTTKEALGDDVLIHAYKKIQDRFEQKIELIVFLMANAACITGKMIDEGIDALRKNPDLDSAVSVSEYNMWSPLRARKIEKDGCLHPFASLESLGDVSKMNCDRNSQGDCYFADMGVSIIRPACIENIEHGQLPQKWMGQKIHPILSWGGCDVDYEWQIPMVDFWLKHHGFKEVEAS